MRKLLLAVLLSTVGYGCATQNGTTVTGSDREGRFAKDPLHLGTCVAMGAHVRNAELYLAIGGEPGDYSILASRTKDGSPIWTIIANKAGSNSSDVRLRGSGASAAELDEMWRIVEFCESYEPG
ncbi:hypothetical protein [Dongia sp.]|uniref:hypothetical protein n=1 Tax=Dongia sp. TaxID=1977262 RepID=UPI0037502E40